jgi:ribosomal protein S18 acetylase RimI-like enzyme
MAFENKNIFMKLYYTFKEFKKTSYHHYGNNKASIFKMLYYSAIHINSFIIYERVLDNSIKSLELEFEFIIEKPDMKRLGQIRNGKELPREFYYDKIHGINNCYLVMCGEEPAYIHWVYVKGDYNRFLILPELVAELNYNTTLPPFRGRKIMAKMMLYIMSDLKKQGFRKVVGVVNIQNPPAIKSMETAGFREVRKIKTIGYFNRRYAIL